MVAGWHIDLEYPLKALHDDRLLLAQYHIKFDKLRALGAYPLGFQSLITLGSHDKMDMRRDQIRPLGLELITAIGVREQVGTQTIDVFAPFIGLPMRDLGISDRTAVRRREHSSTYDDVLTDVDFLFSDWFVMSSGSSVWCRNAIRRGDTESKCEQHRRSQQMIYRQNCVLQLVHMYA